MEDYISRNEHNEFCRRMEEENARQNQQIDLLRENVLEIGQLTTTVAKLAVNMENLLNTQRQQEKRLSALETRDGEMWRKVTGYIATAIAGIVIGYVFKQFGM